MSLFQSPIPIGFAAMCLRQGRSAASSPYGWWATVSRMRPIRPLAR